MFILLRTWLYYSILKGINFMLVIDLNGENVTSVKTFEFSSGCEPHVKLNMDAINSIDWCNRPIEVKLKCKIRNCNDIFKILLATDALKRIGVKYIDLFIPYVPFARQDRVMVDGEPLSIKVFADIINAQNYNSVTFFDAHSDVTPALINNSINRSNSALVKQAISYYKSDNYLIVSPDSGAFKKIYALCERIGYTDHIVLCNKHRNVTNGQIDGIICDTDDFEGKELFIVDDICDGGGTFVLLAEELRKRNCGRINLIVTHGIFSKGIEALHNIDHVFTSDSINSYDTMIGGKLKVFKISSFD